MINSSGIFYIVTVILCIFAIGFIFFVSIYVDWERMKRSFCQCPPAPSPASSDIKFEKITETLKSVDSVSMAIEKMPLHFDRMREYLNFLPMKFHSKELCDKVSIYSPYFAYIYFKIEFWTPLVVYRFVKYGIAPIYNFPEELLTPETCLLAVEKFPQIIQYVPKKYFSVDIFLHAHKHGLDFEKFIEIIPADMLPIFNRFLSVRENGLNLKKIPIKERSMEICCEAVKQNPDAILYVPKSIKDIVMSRRYFESSENRKFYNIVRFDEFDRVGSYS